MRAITKIRANQTGWVVYFDNDPSKFHVFGSTEHLRFIEFITKHVTEVGMDVIMGEYQAALAAEREVFKDVEGSRA